MSFRVGIPSYKRADTLRSKTLPMLARQNVAPHLVTVFVANEAEKDLYQTTLGKSTYGEIVVGTETLRGNRNFMQRYYSTGERVVYVDDDITSLHCLADGRLADWHDFAGMAELGFEHCERVGARLWGIYPVLNPYFMKMSVTYDLKYVIGCLYGVINSHEDVLTVALEDKEDFERTLKCYSADGAVVRLNYVAPKTNYYKEAGGMQVTRTEERVTWSAQELVRRFPHLCTLNLAKKSGHAEVRLRDQRRRQKVLLAK